MVKLKDINDTNIADLAESLLFYEKYEPVLDYLERKKELWISEENYLQLREVSVDFDRNPEFSLFLRYLGENKIEYKTDRNNHVKVAAGSTYYVVWSYATEQRIEKWCFEGVPIAYYYTEKRKFYVTVADEHGTCTQMKGAEAIEKIFK